MAPRRRFGLITIASPIGSDCKRTYMSTILVAKALSFEGILADPDAAGSAEAPRSSASSTDGGGGPCDDASSGDGAELRARRLCTEAMPL